MLLSDLLRCSAVGASRVVSLLSGFVALGDRAAGVEHELPRRFCIDTPYRSGYHRLSPEVREGPMAGTVVQTGRERFDSAWDARSLRAFTIPRAIGRRRPMQVHSVLAATAGGDLHEASGGMAPHATLTVHVEHLVSAWAPGEESYNARRLVANDEAMTLYFDQAQDAPAILDSLILDFTRLRTRLQLKLEELPKAPERASYLQQGEELSYFDRQRGAHAYVLGGATEGGQAGCRWTEPLTGGQPCDRGVQDPIHKRGVNTDGDPIPF